MKKLLSLLVVATMLLVVIAACTPQAETPEVSEPEETEAVAETEAEEAEEEETADPSLGDEIPFDERGYKIAYILNGTATDIFKMAFDAAEAEAEKLGMTLDVFMSQGDDVVFQDIINQCIEKDYDGLYISHGKSDYAYDIVSRAVEAGKAVVTFDTVIEDEEGNGVPGVTTMFQDDFAMADISLDYIVNELFPDTRPVRLLKLWRGPGIPPFDRRQTVYQEYEEQGLIETLEVLGPSDPANSEGSMNTVTASVLPAYPEGTVDAIWSAYDAYGRGAYKALLEAGRTDIPLVTIDISNQDINYMLEDPDRFKACVAVHFENVGIQGVRLLAKKLHSDETPADFALQPSLVRAEDLEEGANVLNLHEIVEGYGVVDDNWEPWMEELQND
ncbi:MAG: substrate-binding domain-containing protein [Chloroflexota bacterium]|jgi:simple sugar transport system substrate-binding protein|nr:substrate-binding domain-containing protein [Chloroflexota bacterium]